MMVDLKSAAVTLSRLTITVQGQIETNNEEVETCQSPRAGDGVVRKDVSHDGEFGVQGNRRPGKRANQWGERTFREDLLQRVEEQFTEPSDTLNLYSHDRLTSIRKHISAIDSTRHHM